MNDARYKKRHGCYLRSVFSAQKDRLGRDSAWCDSASCEHLGRHDAGLVDSLGWCWFSDGVLRGVDGEVQALSRRTLIGERACIGESARVLRAELPG